MKEPGSAGVVTKEKIMQNYLDNLLQSATENLLEEEQQDKKITAEKISSIPDTSPLESTENQIIDSVHSVKDLQVASLIKNEQGCGIVSDEFSARAWLDNGRPYWGQSRFECLMFKVFGLKLAAPLIEMGTIVKVEQQLTPIFAQPEWFLGLLSYAGRNIKVVDTTKLIMPERYDEEAKKNICFVITMDGTDWGMAIHDLLHAITLEPDAVNWKGKHGQRPWLAGTIVDEMCALLDVGHLAELLVQEQQRFVGKH